MTPGEFRLRLCYGKVGRLRFLSHLEVVHTLQRSIRRAQLPYAITQGFSPHLKAAFGPALPVGTAGEREYLDVWLTRYTESAQVLEALRGVSAEELSPREAGYVADNAPSLTAALTIARYRIEVEGEQLGAEKVHADLMRVIAGREFVVEHKGKHKVFDLARSIPKEPRVDGREGGVEIDLVVRMGQEGSLRPEKLITTALAESLHTTSVVRTTRIEALVESEEGVWSRPV